MVRALRLLRRLRWRRATLARELLGYARLVFAGILLQAVIPGSPLRGVVAERAWLVWAIVFLLAMTLDGAKDRDAAHEGVGS
jgi:hypothetical protein